MKNVIMGLVLVFAASSAFAGFAGYTDGVFVDPIGGPGAVVSGVGTNQIVTGSPAMLFGSTTKLSYTGNQFSGVVGSPFKIGSLCFENGNTCPGSSIDGITLAVETTFTQPEYFQDVYDVGLGFEFERFYDSLVMDNVGEKYAISDSGYCIEILGFNGCVCGFTDTMSVGEWGTGCKDIYAKVTACPAVPAPGAILLAGIGVSFVGWIRRRKQA